MVTSKKTMDKIRKIVERQYARLVVSVLGPKVLSESELRELESMGVDVSNKDSLLTMVYNHGFVNHPVDEHTPTSKEDMKAQMSVLGLAPEGEAHSAAIDGINEKTKQYIDKLKLNVMTRVESLIRENNDTYRMNALQNLDRSNEMDELVKESSLGKLKSLLKDTAGEAAREWRTVAITEIANSLGISSVDRIVTNNREKDLKDVYVYRVTVKDARTCKYCKRFYNDDDGSPKLYRLSTLLSNGSNYGKKADAWRPTHLATHPNERCSGMLELKPGWALTSSGAPTYIGLEKWNSYIVDKLHS